MDELADLFIVSQVALHQGDGGVKGAVEGLGVEAGHAAGAKCLRCWKFTPDVGENGPVPALRQRSGYVIFSLSAVLTSF